MKRINAATGITLLALAAAGCSSGRPSEQPANQSSKPTIYCYSSDAYRPESGLPPCYDGQNQPVTEAQINEPGFWSRHKIGYILTFEQQERLRARADSAPPNIPVNQRIIEAFRQLSDSDVYVLDISDSMDSRTQAGGGLTRWQVVAGQEFPESADLYVFGGRHGLQLVTDRSNLERLCCDGGTPLWRSISEVIETGRYKTITVFTDGGDDGRSLGSSSQVISAATKRDMKINIIGGAGPVHDLEQVTQRTGGQYIPIF